MTTLPAKSAEKTAKRERKLTPKQKIFFKKYLEELGKGTYKTKAIVIAHKHAKYKGKNEQSRESSGYQILEKINSISSFAHLLDMAGMDDNQIAANISQLSRSTRPLVVKGDVEYVPDNYARVKANELAMKHKGLLGGSGGVAIQINLSDRAAGLAVPMQPASIIDVETTDD